MHKAVPTAAISFDRVTKAFGTVRAVWHRGRHPYSGVLSANRLSATVTASRLSATVTGQRLTATMTGQRLSATVAREGGLEGEVTET
jgi:hypothetical protein